MKKRHVDELKALVGEKNVSTDRKTIASFFETAPADADLTLVRPETHEDLGLAAGYAYDNDIPMFTHKRGFLDERVASSGGILFDLSGMDEIRRIDEPNMLAFVEYGVTFERMKQELDKIGMRILMPASATSSSIVRSYVDRDVILANGATRPYQISIFHAILADGRLWMSGNDQLTPDGHSEFREDFGPMYSYFFHASEDIFGMPYAAKVFIYRRWEERRVTAYGFDEPESAVRAAFLASKHDQVFECVVASRKYLAVLLSDSASEALNVESRLAPWNVVFGFDNHKRLVDVWDRQTEKICLDLGGKRDGGDLAGMMYEKFEFPWYVRERDHYRGFTETIDFYALSGKVCKFFEKVRSSLPEYELGYVAIPSYYGASFYCEADIYTEKKSPALEDSWFRAYVEALDSGAHVGRPRGKVAKLIYEERLDRENIGMIKNLKSVLDPKGLLNRGQLIEGV